MPPGTRAVFSLRDEVREEKRAIEHHRRLLREKAAQLEEMCEALGFDYEEVRSQGRAHRPDNSQRN